MDSDHANRSAEKAFVAGDLHDLGALGAFHQHLDIAVGQLHALHDIRERAYLVDFFRLGVVHGRVMLRDQENLLVAGQRVFQRAHGRFAAHDEGVHHLRENDHFPHRHHRYALDFAFFAIEHRVLFSPGTLARFFQQAPIDFASLDHVRRHDEVAQLPLRRQVIHHFQHQIFQNHAQAARAHFAL